MIDDDVGLKTERVQGSELTKVAKRMTGWVSEKRIQVDGNQKQA
jgi:hypothetical protein